MVHNRNHEKADLLQNTTWETSTSCETSRGVLHAHLVYTRLDGAGWEPCDCRTHQPFLQAQPEGITQSRATHRKWPMEMEGGTETMLGLRKDYSCNLRIHTCFVCKDKWETETCRAVTLYCKPKYLQGANKLLLKSLSLALKKVRCDITSY